MQESARGLLSIGFFRLYNSKYCKIIWPLGHQCRSFPHIPLTIYFFLKNPVLNAFLLAPIPDPDRPCNQSCFIFLAPKDAFGASFLLEVSATRYIVDPFRRSFGFFSTILANFAFWILFAGCSDARGDASESESSCRYSSGRNSGRFVLSKTIFEGLAGFTSSYCAVFLSSATLSPSPSPSPSPSIDANGLASVSSAAVSFRPSSLFRFLSASSACFFKAASRSLRFRRIAASCLGKKS
jgi:hypothetical protein